MWGGGLRGAGNEKVLQSIDLQHFAFVLRPLVCTQRVPRTVPFSNQFMHDLNILWELHEWIPDPTIPTYSKS